jgi:hypothetical protein
VSDDPAPRSARVAYRAKLERARTLLSTLTETLDQHVLEHVRRPDRWDLVDDLRDLNDKLGEAAATLEPDRERGGGGTPAA